MELIEGLPNAALVALACSLCLACVFVGMTTRKQKWRGKKLDAFGHVEGGPHEEHDTLRIRRRFEKTMDNAFAVAGSSPASRDTLARALRASRAKRFSRSMRKSNIRGSMRPSDSALNLGLDAGGAAGGGPASMPRPTRFAKRNTSFHDAITKIRMGLRIAPGPNFGSTASLLPTRGSIATGGKKKRRSKHHKHKHKNHKSKLTHKHGSKHKEHKKKKLKRHKSKQASQMKRHKSRRSNRHGHGTTHKGKGKGKRRRRSTRMGQSGLGMAGGPSTLAVVQEGGAKGLRRGSVASVHGPPVLGPAAGGATQSADEFQLRAELGDRGFQEAATATAAAVSFANRAKGLFRAASRNVLLGVRMGGGSRHNKAPPPPPAAKKNKKKKKKQGKKNKKKKKKRKKDQKKPKSATTRNQERQHGMSPSLRKFSSAAKRVIHASRLRAPTPVSSSLSLPSVGSSLGLPSASDDDDEGGSLARTASARRMSVSMRSVRKIKQDARHDRERLEASMSRERERQKAHAQERPVTMLRNARCRC